MNMAEWRIQIARLLVFGAIACGILGLVIGVADREWKLGVTGWFTAGTLVALLAVAVFADEYFVSRRRQREQ